MVSALDSGWSDLGSSPSRGHRTMFLGKTLYSHSTSLHPGGNYAVYLMLGGNPSLD